jgi:hypothetical protein
MICTNYVVQYQHCYVVRTSIPSFPRLAAIPSHRPFPQMGQLHLEADAGLSPRNEAYINNIPSLCSRRLFDERFSGHLLRR